MALTTPPLFLPMRFSVNRAFWERLMDAIHLPYFAAITVLFFLSIRGDRLSAMRRAFLAGTAAVAWAGAVELLQPLTGRSKDIHDFGNGSLGAGLAVLLLAGRAFVRPLESWSRAVLAAGWGAAAVGALLFTLQPAWREGRGICWRMRNFPLLGDFETEDEMRLWIAPDADQVTASNTALDRSMDFASRGKYSLRVRITGPGWAGVRFLAADQDWRGYAVFACEIYNLGEPFSVGLRIDDSGSTDRANRYTGSLPLGRGWNQIRLPLAQIASSPPARPLEMKAIRRVIFFVDGTKERGQAFYLDDARLELNK